MSGLGGTFAGGKTSTTPMVYEAIANLVVTLDGAFTRIELTADLFSLHVGPRDTRNISDPLLGRTTSWIARLGRILARSATVRSTGAGIRSVESG